MCLIFTDSPTNAPLSDAWLQDFYDRNQDGWGFMWFNKDTGAVQTHKALGKEVEWVASYRSMRALGVDFVTHLRMKTHGAIDLENTHPYEVNDHLHIMHNGILSSGYGVGGDKTKSDTWHYIRDTLHPLLEYMPIETLMSPPLQSLIGSAIGNNRFVFMGPSGQAVIFNRHQGVEWHDRWMSNTYAWSAHKAPAPDTGPRVIPKYSYAPADANKWDNRKRHKANSGVNSGMFRGQSYSDWWEENAHSTLPAEASLGNTLASYDKENGYRVPSLWNTSTANNIVPIKPELVELEDDYFVPGGFHIVRDSRGNMTGMSPNPELEDEYEIEEPIHANGKRNASDEEFEDAVARGIADELTEDYEADIEDYEADIEDCRKWIETERGDWEAVIFELVVDEMKSHFPVEMDDGLFEPWALSEYLHYNGAEAIGMVLLAIREEPWEGVITLFEEREFRI